MTEARRSPQQMDCDVRGPMLAEKIARLEVLAAELAAGLAEIRNLSEGETAADAFADDPLVPIAFAAQSHHVSKATAKKQAKRMGLAVQEGGRLKIHLSAVEALYPRNMSRLSPLASTLSPFRKPKIRDPLDGRR